MINKETNDRKVGKQGNNRKQSRFLMNLRQKKKHLQATKLFERFIQSSQPTIQPSLQPTKQPNIKPSKQPFRLPTDQPSHEPSKQPSFQPLKIPSLHPSSQPTIQPSLQPTKHELQQMAPAGGWRLWAWSKK
jgi:hypothetical protein